MLDQFKTLIWLRFIVFRHTLTGGKAVSILLTAIVCVGALLVSLGVGAVLFKVGADLKPSDANAVLLISDACLIVFLFFWMFGMLLELQRSETIDFRKMLFLPVSLPVVFLLNYGVAVFSPALILFAFPAFAWSAGLALGMGARMWLALPIAAVFYLMLASWTYYVRGILAAVMENKRRRRYVVTLIAFLFVLLGQMPNILVHTVIEPQSRNLKAQAGQPNTPKPQGWTDARAVEMVRMFHIPVPPFWLPYGLYGIARGEAATPVACAAGMGALTLLGLALGYRSTRRYYMGTASGKTREPVERVERGSRLRPSFAMRRLPFVDDDTAAVAVASWLSYLRQPNIYLMLIMPVVMGVGFMVVYAPNVLREGGQQHSGIAPFFVTVWPILNFAALMSNLFGMDRTGFRAFILLPTERRKYLLGKNLALFPMVGGLSTFFVISGAVLLRPGWVAFLISIVHTFYLYLIFCTMGNFLSIRFPYRMGWEGMRGKRPTAYTFFAALFVLTFSAVLMAPTLLCLYLDSIASSTYGYEGVSLGLVVSVAMLAMAVVAYRYGLNAAGKLLTAREQTILDTLVRDRE